MTRELAFWSEILRELGVEENEKEAKVVFQQVLESKCAQALFSLGTLYAEGLLESKSGDEVPQLFRQAAAAGLDDAEYELGLLYAHGKFVPRNEGLAMLHLGNAASNMHGAALYALGHMFVNIAPKKAADYFRIAAWAGILEAVTQLGCAYLQGLGVEKNEQKAFALFEYAAEAGCMIAMANLGTMFIEGRAVEMDQAWGVKLYEMAASCGEPQAMANLGSIYFNGIGFIKDERKAIKWYARAAKKGHESSMRSLAWIKDEHREKHETRSHLPTREATLQSRTRAQQSFLE